MRTLIVIGIVSICFYSCTKPAPRKTSVNLDTLATVYAELLVLNERYTLSKDSLSAVQYEAEYGDILRRHNYSKDRFGSELGSVVQSSDDFKQLCDRALTNFQRMRPKPSIPVQRGRS